MIKYTIYVFCPEDCDKRAKVYHGESDIQRIVVVFKNGQMDSAAVLSYDRLQAFINRLEREQYEFKVIDLVDRKLYYV